VLQAFVDAFERADLAGVAAVLHEDVQGNMPPYPFWYRGRDANITAMGRGFHPESPDYLGTWRTVPARANLQPAAAFYVKAPGDSEYRAFALDVLRVRDGKVTEITAFAPELFPAFGLSPTL
jgi:RNA polymerase sigma-70 factor (ECF subfamily)